MKKIKTIKIGICEGRHPLPVESYVFPQEVNPLDVKGLTNIADEFFSKIFIDNIYDAIKDSKKSADKLSIELYATGLTVAVLSSLKGATNYCDKVTVMHYDRDSNTYYPQQWK